MIDVSGCVSGTVSVIMLSETYGERSAEYFLEENSRHVVLSYLFVFIVVVHVLVSVCFFGFIDPRTEKKVENMDLKMSIQP